jgi:hypothetical protein
VLTTDFGWLGRPSFGDRIGLAVGSGVLLTVGDRTVLAVSDGVPPILGGGHPLVVGGGWHANGVQLKVMLVQPLTLHASEKSVPRTTNSESPGGWTRTSASPANKKPLSPIPKDSEQRLW